MNYDFLYVKYGIANAVAKGKVIGRPITTRENLTSIFIKHYINIRLNR